MFKNVTKTGNTQKSNVQNFQKCHKVRKHTNVKCSNPNTSCICILQVLIIAWFHLHLLISLTRQFSNGGHLKTFLCFCTESSGAHNLLIERTNAIDLKTHWRIICIPNEIGIIPNEIEIIPNRIGIIPNEIEIIPNKIEIIPNEVGIISNEIGITPNEIGIISNEIGIGCRL